VKRSSVFTLPPEIKAELDKRLLNSGFQNYTGLAEWLNENDCKISRSSVHRYGKDFQHSLSQIKVITQQAKAICSEIGDDENALSDAVIRLTQQKAFEFLLNLDLDDENHEKLTIRDIGTMVATLSRSSVTVRDHRNKMLAQIDKKLKEMESAPTDKRKVSAEALRIVREEIYGIFEKPNESN
jgi:ferritin